MPLPALQLLEKRFEKQIRLFELKRGALERTIGTHIRRFEKKNGICLDDEMRFIRSWIGKPLSIGAVTPSGKVLARAMASYVDPAAAGPVVELGPGTGPITEALVAQGIDPARLVLVEFDPTFCRLLREPAAAIVSGLPLFTKPLKIRLKLLYEALALMAPGAPFVQFTYATVAPIPRALDRVRAEGSERIWMNIPPARVWVYRRS
jgi:phosphatidylethanolamine/phosphatidyl-N-methylethanolamine N-methyltransferase